MSSSASSWPDRVELASIELGPPIGDGGEGQVFLLNDNPLTVFKKYNTGTLAARRRSTLESQTQARTALRVDGETIDRWSAWPHTLVFDQGVPVGFLMPRIPEEFMVVIAGSPRLAELSYLATPPKPMWGTQFQPPGTQARLDILGKLAAVLEALHARGYVYGDLSFANVVWTTRGPARIMLLDCDGITDTRSGESLDAKDTVDWDDPHSAGLSPSTQTDDYKLSLAVLRVLTQQLWPRPTIGQQWSLPPDLHPDSDKRIRDLLERAAGTSDQRPTAAEWTQALRRRDSYAVSPPKPRPASSLPVREGILHDSSPARTMRPVQPPTAAPSPSASPATAPDAAQVMILELVVPSAPPDLLIAEAIDGVLRQVQAHPMAAHIALGWTCYGVAATAPAAVPAQRVHAIPAPPAGTLADRFGDVFHRVSQQLAADIASLKGQGFRVLRPAVIVLQPTQVLDTQSVDTADLTDPANTQRPNISVVAGQGVTAAGIGQVVVGESIDAFTHRLFAEVKRVVDRLAEVVQPSGVAPSAAQPTMPQPSAGDPAQAGPSAVNTARPPTRWWQQTSDRSTNGEGS